MFDLVATILRPGNLAPNVHVTVENVILIGALFYNMARVDLNFENVVTAWNVGDVNPLKLIINKFTVELYVQFEFVLFS